MLAVMTERSVAVPANAVDEAAERLRVAAATRTPCAPVRDLIGPDDVVTAYAVQAEVTGGRIAAGARVVGRKIGLTSKAVQDQLGVDQPDLGVLFADMEHEAGGVVPLAGLLQPKVEAEVAFVIGEDLAGGDLSLSQVAAAVDHVVAALEICDSRIADWDITFGDTVADNASAGAYVLGTERRTLAEVAPREVTMSMTVTGQEDSTGTGAACLGDPLLALQWLARQARELGDPLRAGQIVLSGALGPMRPVSPGAQVHAVISGLGEVSVRFEEES
jgi:2-keto-4-pentenoate hydratase